ncbi:hypothetical protein Tco_0935245, partial [Tanacetum coccineum]
KCFLYGQIEEEVYICQPPGFEDPDHPDKIQQKKNGIFISQDKYVHEILRKFNYSDVKSVSTPTDLEKPLVKDADADDVDEHLYRSMIGSLMYLTASRPDIMFAVCACARFQVTPKTSHLLAVKRIFRYLKGKPTLGLWYSRDSPFELVAYTDSDYAGATQDRKSTTGGCQFLGNRLISWQCKKQTVVATSTTEAEYVAAASCCGQVLWIQNQLLDYGYNFMNTVINIDNNNLLTKGFDAGIFQYLVSSSGSRCQDTILGNVDAQTRFEITSKQSNDPPLSRGYTLGSGEDSMKLIRIDGILLKFVLLVFLYAVKLMLMLSVQVSAAEEVFQDEPEHEESVPTPSNDPQPSSEDSMQLTELMVLCTKLQTQVLDLQKAKDAQAKEIVALKKRIQRLERKKMSRPTGLKRLRKFVEMEKNEQSTKPDDSSVEGSAAQTLIQIKAVKPKVVTTVATTTTTTRPKARGVVVQEPSEFKVPQETQSSISKDKGKGIMIEPEVSLKRKYQIALDEQIARDIQAKLDAELLEEQKLYRRRKACKETTRRRRPT